MADPVIMSQTYVIALETIMGMIVLFCFVQITAITMDFVIQRQEYVLVANGGLDLTVASLVQIIVLDMEFATTDNVLVKDGISDLIVERCAV